MIDSIVSFVKTVLEACSAIWESFKTVKDWFK